MKKDIAVVHVYSVLYNEKVLLPYFLRHYGSIADRIVLYDHGSSDGSREIAQSHPAVELRNLDTDGHLRDDIILDTKKHVWKESRGKADLVIVCDIDEFVWHPKLRDFLNYSGTEQEAIQPLGFSMYSPSLPTTNGQIYDEIRKGVRDACWLDKVVLFNPSKVEEINYSPGCHTCKPAGERPLGACSQKKASGSDRRSRGSSSCGPCHTPCLLIRAI